MYSKLRENWHYLGRVPPQHQRPKFIGWLDKNIQPFFDAEKLVKSLDEAFDLDLSVGVQMDVTGDIVGRNRTLSFDPADGSSPVLDDETYRLLQKAKISMNQWDGTIPGVFELWSNLFPQYELIIQDNQNMTMDIFILGSVTPLQRELIVRGYAAPKPFSVGLHYSFIYEHEPLHTDVYVAGATHGDISRTGLPAYVPNFHFKGDVFTLGAVHSTPVTQLPPIEKDHSFTAQVSVMGAMFSSTCTTLPPITKDLVFENISYISGATVSITKTQLPAM